MVLENKHHHSSSGPSVHCVAAAAGAGPEQEGKPALRGGHGRHPGRWPCGRNMERVRSQFPSLPAPGSLAVWFFFVPSRAGRPGNLTPRDLCREAASVRQHPSGPPTNYLRTEGALRVLQPLDQHSQGLGPAAPRPASPRSESPGPAAPRAPRALAGGAWAGPCSVAHAQHRCRGSWRDTRRA